MTKVNIGPNSYEVLVKAGDCGQIDDGTFGPGNDCAAGRGSGGSSDKPKGAPGKDKEKQREQQKTTEFKEWFGQSKVVDENGNPLVVYHGTDSEFEEFRTDILAEGWGRGAYLTSSEEVASEFGDKVVPAYVRIENPYRGDYIPEDKIRATPTGQRIVQEQSEDWGPGEDYTDFEYLYTEPTEEFGQILRELGYDGVISRGSNNMPPDVDEIVVFDPNQIKSPTGNTGDFSRDSDNINKSYRVTLKAGDCGQESDGTFGPGNDCAAGRGGGGSTKTPEDRDGMPLVDMNDNPVKTNPDGTITLYHGTTKENARRIQETGRFLSKESTREAFFATDKRDTEGYGDGTIVELNIDPALVRIDDAFRGKETSRLHVAARTRDIPQDSVVAVHDDKESKSSTTKSYRVTVKASDCGAHGGPGGGFTTGNSCAEGRGGAGTAEKETPKTEHQQAVESQREKRQANNDKEAKRRADHLKDIGIKEVDEPFGAVDDSPENVKRFEDHTESLASMGKLHPDDPDYVVFTDDAKALYLKSYDVADDVVEAMYADYPELMEDGFIHDEEHFEIRKKQAEEVGRKLQEVIQGANLHLAENGTQVLDQTATAMYEYAKKELFKSNSEETVEKVKRKLAESLATSAAIPEAQKRIGEAFRKSGQKLPDYSDLVFTVTNESAKDWNGLQTSAAKGVRGGVFGFYKSSTGQITLDSADGYATSFEGWAVGSEKYGPVGNAVHEIAHHLHHRKLMNKYADYKSKSSPDITAAGNRQRSMNFHRLMEKQKAEAARKQNLLVGRHQTPSKFELVKKYKSTQAKVGRYGMTNFKEFVAEAFAIKVLQPDLWDELDDVRELYDLLEGP